VNGLPEALWVLRQRLGVRHHRVLPEFIQMLQAEPTAVSLPAAASGLPQRA